MAANSVTPMAKPPMARASRTSATLPGAATVSIADDGAQARSSIQPAESVGAMNYRNATNLLCAAK
ncbi:hypothetical protein D3C80_1806650 [compost metagenome]